MVVPDHTSVPMFPEAVSRTVLCPSKINHGPPDPRRSRIRSQNPFSLKSGTGPLLRLALGESGPMTDPQQPSLADRSVDTDDTDDVEQARLSEV